MQQAISSKVEHFEVKRSKIFCETYVPLSYLSLLRFITKMSLIDVILQKPGVLVTDQKCYMLRNNFVTTSFKKSLKTKTKLFSVANSRTDNNAMLFVNSVVRRSCYTYNSQIILERFLRK